MLHGKSIIVTGAGSGIGRAAAELFARSGGRVILADIDLDAATNVADHIRNEGQEAYPFRANVAIESDVVDLMAFAQERTGGIDGAFNNAGVAMHNKPLHELSEQEWSHVIGVDLTGVFFCLKHEIAAMLRQGRSGSIVNTASGLGAIAQPGAADYCAAKSGVLGLTRAAATDYGRHGIRVNALLPGLIETPIVQQTVALSPAFAEQIDAMRVRHSLGRFGAAPDVAMAAQWLLSDQSAFVTGVSLPVDGGYLAR